MRLDERIAERKRIEVEVALAAYFNVLVADGDLRVGSVQDYDISFLAGKVIEAINKAEIEEQRRFDEMQSEYAGGN